jgi:hypothetical protein
MVKGLVAFLHLVTAASAAFVLHDSRPAPPSGYVHEGAAPLDHNITFRIALAWGDAAGLETTLWNISHPASARYGQWLSAGQSFGLGYSPLFILTPTSCRGARGVCPTQDGDENGLDFLRRIERSATVRSVRKRRRVCVHDDSGARERTLSRRLPSLHTRVVWRDARAHAGLFPAFGACGTRSDDRADD